MEKPKIIVDKRSCKDYFSNHFPPVRPAILSHPLHFSSHSKTKTPTPRPQIGVKRGNSVSISINCRLNKVSRRTYVNIPCQYVAAVSFLPLCSAFQIIQKNRHIVHRFPVVAEPVVDKADASLV